MAAGLRQAYASAVVVVEFVRQVFHYDVSYYALSQVAVIAAFTAIWFMGRAMLGASRALAAVLLLDGVNYFHFTAVKFNHESCSCRSGLLLDLCIGGRYDAMKW
jgi:hypothetical protein